VSSGSRAFYFWEHVVATRTFEQWIDGIFDHPIVDPAWYWDIDADTCVEEREINVAYLTLLFTNCDNLLRRFSDDQVGQGFHMIVSSSCSDHSVTITTDRVPWPARQAAIRAIFDVYVKCFSRRCSERLGHLGEPGGPLNWICYMWWDVFAAWIYPAESGRQDEFHEYIAVMERCLTLSHPACLEGALHGLGHCCLNYPELVEPIIDRFLIDQRQWRPELLSYAQRARRGAVQ
jgi:hypothetical protein